MINTTTLDRISSLIKWSPDEHERLHSLIEETLIFSSREEYLAWVLEWKAQHEEIITDIRRYKIARKLGAAPHKGSSSGNAEYQRQYLRGLSYSMQIVRKEGKEKAAHLRASRIASETA